MDALPLVLVAWFLGGCVLFPSAPSFARVFRPHINPLSHGLMSRPPDQTAQMIEQPLIPEPRKGAGAVDLLLSEGDTNRVENVRGKTRPCCGNSQAAQNQIALARGVLPIIGLDRRRRRGYMFHCRNKYPSWPRALTRCGATLFKKRGCYKLPEDRRARTQSL